MDRDPSPIMDVLDLPNSPRKKLKLEEHVEIANTVSETPAIQEVIARPQTASTDQITEPNMMASSEISPSSQLCTSIAPVAVSSSAMSEYKVENSHRHGEAQFDLQNKKAVDTSKARTGFSNATDALDDRYSKETACGITEFVSPDLLGFSGILKKRFVFSIATIDNSLSHTHRYADFLVNEILPSGEVVHLDNLKAHPKPHKNTGLSRGAGRASLANTTGRKEDESTVKTEQTSGKEEGAATARDSTPRHSRRPSPHPDTPNLEHPTSMPKNDLSVVEAQQAIPDSMQDFNAYEPAPAPPEEIREKISPHKRIPPAVASIPRSLQDLDVEEPEMRQEKATRRKEKVHIRQTSQGWVEFDKEKEDEMAKRKAEDEAAADAQAKDDTVMEDIKQESTTNVPEFSELDQERVPQASTQASWQAFAGSAPSGSFQVSNQVIRRGT